MAIPAAFEDRLRLPLIQSPMFIASTPKLVIENCKAGVVGTFPALNQRSSEGFEAWLIEIKSTLADWGNETGEKAAPFGVNLIVHRSNPRLMADLEICVKQQVPLIITSLGASADLIEAVHGYGGLVFHDVINARHARKAAGVGVDGLIAVSVGAGGHGGVTNPFALVSEIRQFFDKTVLLGGSLSNGKDIAAAELMGADMAYMGTRFLNTHEAQVDDAYKQLIIESSANDIVYTPKISGVNANFIRKSVEDAGIDLGDSTRKVDLDFGSEMDVDANEKTIHKRPWLDIWSAGHGVGSIQDISSVAQLVETLSHEYHDAIDTHQKKYTRRQRNSVHTHQIAQTEEA